jgi:hypothetical protein
MSRIAYWNQIPSPYMVERFNALAGINSLDFEVWFSARTESGQLKLSGGSDTGIFLDSAWASGRCPYRRHSSVGTRPR